MTRRHLLIIPLLALGLAGMATALQGVTLWDVETVRAFQGNGALTLPMEAITTLGADGFILALVLLLYWCIDKPLGTDLALLMIISGSVNITVKALLQGPRPFWSDVSLRLSSGRSFSTPSGHAANSTALFGYLAWWLVARLPQEGKSQESRPQRLWGALLLLCIFLVCLSRVYLGVHFPGDVIWGCAEGILVLGAFIGLKPRVATWLGGRSLGTQIALATVMAAAVLALGLLFLALQQAPSFPAQDGSMYALARSQAFAETGLVSGLILGAGIGLALERRYVRFTMAEPVVRRVLRYLLGMAGLAAIGLGLGAILPVEPLALGLALRVARIATAALWAVFIWPWLFMRILR